MIHTGDCIEVMRTMSADSVDAIVTDPPYGLEFMGKRWDAFKSPGRGARVRTERAAEVTPSGKGHTTSKGPFLAAGVDQYIAGSPFQAWCEAWAVEALRVTKPGGYLLAFGGTRTHHRLVCGLEDAGWIIRDELDWIYASGFPKGRANLKPAHEPIVLARKPGALRPLNIEECRIAVDPSDPVNGAVWVSRPSTIRPGTQGFVTSMEDGQRHAATAGEKGRWPSNLLLSDPELFDEPNPWVVGSGATASSGLMKAGTLEGHESYGGFPGREMAADTYGDSGGYSRFFLIPKADRADREPVLRGQQLGERKDVPLAALGNKYCEKCGEDWVNPDGLPKCGHGKEFVARRPAVNPKPRDNSHPTVKPVDLMRHLIRLVTPPGGTVLDPFLGSGSTAIAAELEGFPWIGIEREPEYVAIAEARLNGTQRGMGLDVPAPTSSYRPPAKMPPINHDKSTQAVWDFYTTPDEEPAA